jgi:predicted dehydrogenase
MSKTGIGIIGTGKRIRQVIEGLFKVDKNIDIAAINDPSQDSINLTCEQFDITPKIYSDYKDLVKDDKISWVMIGSWNCYHLEHVEASFKAGKNVFCEKPLATNLEDCLSLYKAWKASGKSFMIGFTLRYSPHYLKIKDLVESGAIGRIVSLEFNETLDFNHGGYIMGGWRSMTKNAGTHLLEKCCHDIDIVNWLVKSRIKKASSFGGLNIFSAENSDRIEKTGESKDGEKSFCGWNPEHNPFLNEKDIVDNQVAIMEFENGVRANFHTNCCSGIPERRLYILGTEGAIRADTIEGRIELKKIGFETTVQDLSTEARGNHGGGDELLCSILSDAVRKGRTPVTGMRDAVESAASCFGIDRAMEKKSVVDFHNIWDAVDEVLAGGEV